MEKKVLLSSTLLTIGVFTVLFSISGCDSKDPVPVLEQELITTLELKFLKDGTSEPIIATWKDIDGSGPGVPVIDPIVLDAHSQYALTLRLLDESKTPVVDVTEEILEKDEDHQFFLWTTGVGGMTFTYADEDSNGKPIGLSTTVDTESEGTGTIEIKLIHEPDKNGTGVSSGDPTNAGGDTDLQTSFNLTIVN